MSDFANARFFVSCYGLIAATGFVVMGVLFMDPALKEGGIGLLTGIVGFYMGRRTFRSDEAAAAAETVAATATVAKKTVQAKAAKATKPLADAVGRATTAVK
jgi:hypothetical protein